MLPAFKSTRDALIYIGILAVILIAPVLCQRLLPPRRTVYQTISWAYGGYPYIGDVIYKEEGDIDVAFMGHSHMYSGIDTPAFQKALSEKLQRPAMVRSLCWFWGGSEPYYFMVRDLLENRQVKMIVITDPDLFLENGQPGPFRLHASARYWFRYGDDWKDVEALPWQPKAGYYLCSILNAQRSLLSLIRRDVDETVYPYSESGEESNDVAQGMTINPKERLGSFGRRRGFALDEFGVHSPFVDYSPAGGTRSDAAHFYSSETAQYFQIARDVSPEKTNAYFLKKLGDLVKERHCKLVMMSVPTYAHRRDSVIKEPCAWREILNCDLTLFGVVNNGLFREMSDDDVQKCFVDDGHLNLNGQRLFTEAVTPALTDFYKNEVR